MAPSSALGEITTWLESLPVEYDPHEEDDKTASSERSKTSGTDLSDSPYASMERPSFYLTPSAPSERPPTPPSRDRRGQQRLAPLTTIDEASRSTHTDASDSESEYSTATPSHYDVTGAMTSGEESDASSMASVIMVDREGQRRPLRKTQRSYSHLRTLGENSPVTSRLSEEDLERLLRAHEQKFKPTKSILKKTTRTEIPAPPSYPAPPVPPRQKPLHRSLPSITASLPPPPAYSPPATPGQRAFTAILRPQPLRNGHLPPPPTAPPLGLLRQNAVDKTLSFEIPTAPPPPPVFPTPKSPAKLTTPQQQKAKQRFSRDYKKVEPTRFPPPEKDDILAQLKSLKKVDVEYDVPRKPVKATPTSPAPLRKLPLRRVVSGPAQWEGRVNNNNNVKHVHFSEVREFVLRHQAAEIHEDDIPPSADATIVEMRVENEYEVCNISRKQVAQD